jgi:GT2 family glycosyltransferase
MSSPAVAVVILNFNGRSFLEKFLPQVIQNSPGHQIYLADNASTDDSVKFTTEHFPDVNIISNTGNYGYARGYNEALKSVKADYYILLNSDVEVTANWIEPVISLMEKDKTIAAAQPKLLDYNQQHLFEYAGAAGGFIDKYGYPFCRGRVFSNIETDKQQFNDAREVFWATGACLFVRSNAYWSVGGLDNDYFAHMEEIDLCWRLKNTGHKVYVQPESVVYHVGGGTLNKISSRKTFLNFRNNLMTLAKNHPPKFLAFKILWRLKLDGIAGVRFLLTGNASHCWAVIQAHFAFYRRLPSTFRKRKEIRRNENFQYNRSQMYTGNIVLEFFLRGKKTFSDLQKGFFSE